MPSRRTLISLVASTAFCGFFCFWFLSADVDCGSQHWTCKTPVGIGLVAVGVGFALGLLLTSFTVALGRLLQVIFPSAKGIEPPGKALRIIVLFGVLHVASFGILGAIGWLPRGAHWWLGAFKFFAEEPQGVIVYVPNQ
jgi:hypothetical protein